MNDVIDVVIPARNTHETLAGVVRPFRNHPAIGDIIIVSNPPDLRMSRALNEWGAIHEGISTRYNNGIHLIYSGAEGKGQAVMQGLDKVRTEYVVFCDSDLIGLTEDHIGLLISGALLEEWGVTIGVPDIPDNYPESRDWAWPWVSGQRCIPTSLARRLKLHGYLMETQLNLAARHAAMPVRFEFLKGLTSPYMMTDQRILDMERDAQWGREHGIL